MLKKSQLTVKDVGLIMNMTWRLLARIKGGWEPDFWLAMVVKVNLNLGQEWKTTQGAAPNYIMSTAWLLAARIIFYL